MKITYAKLGDIMPALSKLAKLDLKAIEAVKLARLINKVEAELKPLEETKISLFKKYGEPDEKDGTYHILNKNLEKFMPEYQELLSSEVQIDAEKITIKSDIQIDAASVLALDGVVCFEE